MLYKNYADAAISELERQRTEAYCDYNESKNVNECFECGRKNNELFAINSRCYCTECVCELLREEYQKFSDNITEDNIGAADILKEMISDFSDSELLCYVENRYEKLTE